MNEETQKELIDLAKRAVTFLSMNCNDRDFVFKFRDAIRKAEIEIKGGGDVLDEIH